MVEYDFYLEFILNLYLKARSVGYALRTRNKQKQISRVDKQNMKEQHLKSDMWNVFFTKSGCKWMEHFEIGRCREWFYDVFPVTYWNINAWKEQISTEISFLEKASIK